MKNEKKETRGAREGASALRENRGGGGIRKRKEENKKGWRNLRERKTKRMAGSGERLRQSNEKQSKRGNLERDFSRQNQRKHEVLDTQDFDFQLLKLNAIIKARAYYQMLLHLRLVRG